MTEFSKLPCFSPEKKSMTYAGVGSRNTPISVRSQMTAVAETLAKLGYTLLSGGAEGADTAFEWGAQEKRKIFFAYDADDVTLKIAEEIHPNPSGLTAYGKKLMARNTFQVFGENLDTPVDFVLCWTPDGIETWQERTIKTGGTGQAIEMASRKGIPVLNMANKDWKERLEAILHSDVKEELPKMLDPIDRPRHLWYGSKIDWGKE